jgi:hypothetical protein
LVKQAGDCKEGAPRLMANLYLYKITEYESVSQGANGMQPFHLKDVSTVHEHINLILRSTLR